MKEERDTSSVFLINILLDIPLDIPAGMARAMVFGYDRALRLLQL